ncbi:CcmE/CycJ protein [Truepera radiovictrix DSM 17093]|uniref:Cytochrome c-type biogenesis protein CcmE n=1 Tax=Truepera radiovictrix (strain DSM 17093 / CIP 108686 / LMG 22925 / RQ-24) TaxID=649638 RepID=D7CRR3_TRURR|nr:CcmE/CycJ protein [Truepera radiovictrix DSM 17093]
MGGAAIKRLIYSVAGVALLGVAGTFLYQALANSLVYFILPSEYASAPESYSGRIRLGGLVEKGTLTFDSDALQLAFDITDSVQSFPVRYGGAPPELLRENTGVVVVGSFEDGTFMGDEVLVKHTEVYEPAEGEEIDLDELKEALR